MDIQAYIVSGNLELYSSGLAGGVMRREVEALRSAHPEIAAELQAIEVTLEKLAKSLAIQPRAALKQRILHALEHAADQIDLDHLPPTSRYSNYESWLQAVAHLLPAEPLEDFFAQVLQQNEQLAQTLVVTKQDVPAEVHETIAESFFILKGTCTCTVGTAVYTLNAGDHLEIPLHTSHDIRIDSPYVVAILQHRFA